MHRLVPQWLARFVCGRRGHLLKQYSAQRDGTIVVVNTCRCGDAQAAKVYGGQFPRSRP